MKEGIVKSGADILRSIDENLDRLHEMIYSRNTLKVEDMDEVVLNSLEKRFVELNKLIKFLRRNQYELCR